MFLKTELRFLFRNINHVDDLLNSAEIQRKLGDVISVMQK